VKKTKVNSTINIHNTILSEAWNRAVADFVRVNSKLQQLQTYRAAARRKAGVVEENSEEENLRTMLRIARKYSFLQRIIPTLNPRFHNQAAMFTEQLDRQEKDHHLVGDSGLTLSDLRKEIARVVRAIFETNWKGERQMEEDERERARLDALLKEHQK
jgi:hypothetical protein